MQLPPAGPATDERTSLTSCRSSPRFAAQAQRSSSSPCPRAVPERIDAYFLGSLITSMAAWNCGSCSM